MAKEDGKESITEYLRRLRENRGGAFSVKALKHGGGVKAIAATAASQIHAAMESRKQNTLTVQRKYLPELFSTKALLPPRGGKSPTLKPSVREHLLARGIKVQYAGGLIDFIKIQPKENPNI